MSVSGTSDTESSLAGAQQQQEDWDDWEEEESEGFKSLFSDARFSSLEEVLAYDEAEHGFSLRQYRAKVRWRQRLCQSRQADRPAAMHAAAAAAAIVKCAQPKASSQLSARLPPCL